MFLHEPEHLGYMMACEDGVFRPGSSLKPGRLVDEGMTTFHTDGEEQAAAFMRNEPLCKRGLCRFGPQAWNMGEGTLSLQIRVPRSQATLR